VNRGAAQLSLFGHEQPDFDASFTELTRIELKHGAWIDLARGWLRGHARLFEQLSTGVAWRSDERKMYDKIVDVPRLYAEAPKRGPAAPVLQAMKRALDVHYRTEFTRNTLAYYRDGRDSVAFHGDYVARRMLSDALVATVSVGAPRRFLLRPTGGGRSIGFAIGWGDLIVMGGSCQRTYQHGIPKVAHADPRIAIMYRPAWYDDGRDQAPRDDR
jgi:alkylated DNA repair dioxygenase AlkB